MNRITYFPCVPCYLMLSLDKKVFIQYFAIIGEAENTKLNDFKYFNLQKEVYY